MRKYLGEGMFVDCNFKMMNYYMVDKFGIRKIRILLNFVVIED